MFQITETTEAALTAVTNRIEKHGDEDVPAVSLQISIEAANTLLDQIDPNIRHALYKAVEGQDQLPGVEPATPVLRCNSFDQITLTQAYEGWTLEIDGGIDEDEPMRFAGCKVDKCRVDAKQGGSIVLRLRIGTSDVDADRLGALAMHNGQAIWVRLTPPAKPAAVIDGSTEAFERDHPDAGDLFAAEHGSQPGPDDDEGRGDDDGSGHTDGAPGAGSSDDQMGNDWPFPEGGSETSDFERSAAARRMSAGGTEVAPGETEAGSVETLGAETETKPRGRRGRKAAEVE